MNSKYERARQFLPSNVRKLIKNRVAATIWIGNGPWFAYATNGTDGVAYYLMNAQNGERREAFDRQAIANALETASGEKFDYRKLPLAEMLFDEALTLRRATVAERRVEFDGGVARVLRTDVAAVSTSPGERWEAFLRDHDLYVRDCNTRGERRLTHDGSDERPYSVPTGSRLSQVTMRLTGAKDAPDVIWSPDGSRLITYRSREAGLRKEHLLQNAPGSGEGPIVHTYTMPRAGDGVVPHLEYIAIDVASGSIVQLGDTVDTIISPSRARTAWWSPNGDIAFYCAIERGVGVAHVHAVKFDSQTKNEILTEREKYGVQLAFPEFRHVSGHCVGESELLWYSQRDGWGHLYLYDLASGIDPVQVTTGNWNVRDICHIDHEKREVFLLGSGRSDDPDPCAQRLYRLRLADRSIDELTHDVGDHDISFAPETSAWYIDTCSTAAQAPVTFARRLDGNAHEISSCDVSELTAIGFRFPEYVTVKSADGSFDLTAILIRPSHFDPTNRYPLIVQVYPGPQTRFVPSNFPDPGGRGASFFHDCALAELGFIVMRVDGRGTPDRSRAFLDIAAASKSQDPHIADQAAAVRQIAERFSYIDSTRVGIFGHSGGGYEALRAMLLHPETFHVGISSGGVHDNRDYLWHWGECYIRLPVDETWNLQTNIPLLPSLKGKLLFLIAELDDNVQPAMAYEAVNALIGLDKDFEMIVFPNCNHVFKNLTESTPEQVRLPFLDNPYFIRKRWDFFVRHLFD